MEHAENLGNSVLHLHAHKESSALVDFIIPVIVATNRKYHVSFTQKARKSQKFPSGTAKFRPKTNGKDSSKMHAIQKDKNNPRHEAKTVYTAYKIVKAALVVMVNKFEKEHLDIELSQEQRIK